jgi:3-hydroxybutyryl-CoA dehydratase
LAANKLAPEAVWDASGVSLFFMTEMDIKVGETWSTTRAVTDELIRDFADLSGDHNPIHLDEEFARSTRFGQRIAHGMLSAAFISAVLGNEFRGRKIVYLGQTMRFTAPTFIGDTITTTATVTHIREDRGIVTLSTECRKQTGEITLTGEAKIMVLE